MLRISRRLPGLALLSLIMTSIYAEPPLPSSYGIGDVPSKDEIKTWNIDVSPNGKQLPAGRGNVKAGAKVYAGECQTCHGRNGLEGVNDQLVEAFNPANNFSKDKNLKRTIGNFWPYATTLYDYINRAMPLTAPGSLTSDEVYSLVAYLLYLNKIIDADTVVDGGMLSQIEMPAKRLFYWSDEALQVDNR
jgi:cytochrome c